MSAAGAFVPSPEHRGSTDHHVGEGRELVVDRKTARGTVSAPDRSAAEPRKQGRRALAHLDLIKNLEIWDVKGPLVSHLTKGLKMSSETPKAYLFVRPHA